MASASTSASASASVSSTDPPKVALEWFEVTPTTSTSDCSDEFASHYLTTADPARDRILCEVQIGPEADASQSQDGQVGIFIQISIPVKLRGISTQTPVHVHIHPSQIRSLEFGTDIEAPKAIQAKMPDQRLSRLAMTLSEPVRIIVPCQASSPLRPMKATSGVILDSLRSLGRPTTLRVSIYTAAHHASVLQFPTLFALWKAERAVALPRYQALSRLFGGAGGRIWACESPYVSVDVPNPPRYSGISAGPPRYSDNSAGVPMPPSSEPGAPSTNNRRRCSSDGGAASEVDRSALLTVRDVDQRFVILEGLIMTQTRQMHEQAERLCSFEGELASVRLEAERAHQRIEQLKDEIDRTKLTGRN